MRTNELIKILADIYDVGPLRAPVEAVIWASDRIEDVQQAKADLRAINAMRSKAGIVTARVPYGHRCF
jgi:hypothetical protein